MSIDLQSALKFSDNFVKNRTQMRAYFRDVYPKTELRTINLLLNVYELGIPKLLLIGTGITQNQYNAFISKLEYEYGMTTESAVEALNMWVDACVSQGDGELLSKNFFKHHTKNAFHIAAADPDKPQISLGLNETIYEDENIEVVFVKWERKFYRFGGYARAATFMYVNKADYKIGVYMKDISVDGFVNQGKSLHIPVAAHKKGIEQIPFVYEDKVPGNIDDFRSVEFTLCYGQVYEQGEYTFKGAVRETSEISITL